MELHHYGPSGTFMKTITSIIREGGKEMRKQRNANKQQVTILTEFSLISRHLGQASCINSCSSQEVKEHGYILIITLVRNLPVVEDYLIMSIL